MTEFRGTTQIQLTKQIYHMSREILLNKSLVCTTTNDLYGVLRFQSLTIFNQNN